VVVGMGRLVTVMVVVEVEVVVVEEPLFMFISKAKDNNKPVVGDY